jgi:hypothetical protein
LERASSAGEKLANMRQPGDDYDEAEVVIDPYGLGRVKLIESLAANAD